jgi:MGT family glycosyltransferase
MKRDGMAGGPRASQFHVARLRPQGAADLIAPASLSFIKVRELKVIISSVPLLGHLNAVLGIGRALVEDGHEVVGLSATAFRERVERIGAAFHPFPGAADIDTTDMVAAYPEFATMAPGPEMTLFWFQRVFADPLAEQHQGLLKLMKNFEADLIVTDNLFMGVLPMLLGPRSARPPIMFCGTTYLLWRRDDKAPPNLGLPPAQTESERREYSALAEQVDEVFSNPFRDHLNKCLASVGAPPLEMSVLDAVEYLPDIHLQLTAPSFEYPRPDLPSSVRFVGALPITPNQARLPAWADDLDGSKRIVLVTQGTVSNHDFGQLVEPTLRALAAEPDILVVVTSGGRPIESIQGPIPENVRLASYLPFEWILPKVDVLVTNAGYNTVNQALSFGVPIVAAGLTEDKADVSARVEWTGVGINLRTNAAEVGPLRVAVRAILDEPHYRARAAAMAKDFARIDTRGEVLRIADELAGRGAA